MNEAKEQLGNFISLKRKVDEDVRNIMLNNLDIIKLLKGTGQYKVDLT